MKTISFVLMALLAASAAGAAGAQAYPAKPVPVGSTTAQFGEFIRSEIAKYRKIVKETGITIH